MKLALVIMAALLKKEKKSVGKMDSERFIVFLNTPFSLNGIKLNNSKMNINTSA
jgi:hypothetical protein